MNRHGRNLLTPLIDDSQPSFLQKMRGQLAGDGSGRQERPIPRNKKEKVDDEEDAPTYVMEGTNDSVTKAEYEALLAGKEADGEEIAKDPEQTKSGNVSAVAKKDNIAEVGKASKKRKVAKVIGDEGDGDSKESKDAGKKVTKKAKKKGKSVKLSFGDEEG